MSLFFKSNLHLKSFTRKLSSATPLTSRKQNEKLKQPEDKSTVIIGKQKHGIYYPKEGVSDKTHPIHVKWKKPSTMYTCNPYLSGDVGGLDSLGLQTIDLNQPVMKLLNSKVLKEAPEDVQRVLSLDFARKRDVLDKLGAEVIKSVQRHPRDFSSLEVAIAKKTVTIRKIQQNLIELWPYKNQPLKHLLTHIVSSRRKMLARLRTEDYKKFEWLLEKLNLLYKPMPWDTPFGPNGIKDSPQRVASIERLTDLWCEELQKHKLNAYRKKLESEQPAFLRKKAQKYQEILDMEKELNVPQSITKEEIDDCLKKAEEIEARLAAGKSEEEEEEYLIYKEEVARPENIYIK